MQDPNKVNGWNEWSIYVKKLLENHSEEHRYTREQLQEIKIELAMQKMRNRIESAIVSAMLGIIPAIIVYYLTKGLHG